jgi:hypothetical protein
MQSASPRVIIDCLIIDLTFNSYLNCCCVTHFYVLNPIEQFHAKDNK